MNRVKTQQPATAREVKATAVDRVLLRVRDLCMSFDGQQVLKGVNLNLREGQVVLLRGPNGSGKTTLVNILTGYLSPDKGNIRLFTSGFEEKFAFPRRWWNDLNPWDHFLPERVAREGICRSWQDTRLFRSLPLVDNVAVSASENYAENPLNVLFRPGLSRRTEATVVRRATETLAGLGLKGRSKSSADMISLGQSKRVAIARATGTGARILFLDEPLAGLDGAGIQSIVDLLSQLVEQHRMALVLVEHVSSVHHLLSLVDTIWDLSEGHLKETTKTDSPSDNSVNELNIGLQRLITGMNLAESQLLPGGAILDIYRLPYLDASEPVLEVRDFIVHLGRRLVIGGKDMAGDRITGINLTLCAGDLAVLQAPNGWGKTTLLDCIAGVIQPTQGQISLNGTNILNIPVWKRQRLGISYLRSAHNSFPTLTTAEFLNLKHDLHGLPEKSGVHKVYGELSGGERQKMRLEYLAATKSQLLLLDEPFSALDERSLATSFSWFQDLLHDGAAGLLALPYSRREE